MLGYWVVLLISLAESLAFVGVLVPGTTIVILTGFLASKGVFDLGDLVWFVMIGAILGDGLSFYLGQRGTQLVRPESKLFTASRMQKAFQFFHRHGGKSVFFGRFVGPMRAVIPFIAGMSRMNMREFLLWNMSSALGWAVSYLLLGYFFGHAWQAIETWSTRFSLLLLVLFLVVTLLYWAKHQIVKHGKQMFALLGSIGRSFLTAIRTNSDVQKLLRRHPRFFGFLRDRFRTDQFSGLTLSLLTLAFVYTFALFLGIIEDFLTADLIVAIDVRLQNLFYAFRTPEMVQFFLWVTLLGKAIIIISAALVASAILWLNRQRVYLLPFWLVIIGSAAFDALGKLVFHRPRPEFSVYIEHSFSFPSGHATIAVAFYGFLAYVLWQHTKTRTQKVNLFFLAIGVIAAIGFSRLYLGVHFLSDVWAGYLLGLLWLIIGISLTEWISRQQRHSHLRRFFLSNSMKVVSGCLFAAELGGYVFFGMHYAPPLAMSFNLADKPLPKEVVTIFTDHQLPKYTETLTGRQQEPLSLLLLAYSDADVMAAFHQAGWYRADPITWTTSLKIADAALFNTEYLSAPISPYFWNAQPHDVGFEKPTQAQSVRKRHHVRFWRTHYRSHTGKRLYVGTASLDIGIKWGITHKIAPDIDTERDLVLADLQTAGFIEAYQQIHFVEPTLGYNEFNDPFFTKGISYVIELLKGGTSS